MATARTRVAAVILSAGKVLLHRAGGDEFWALPGGRVERGETAVDGLARELLEELGEEFSIGAELWTCRHSFDHGGETFDECGHYHAAVPLDLAFLQRAGPIQGKEMDPVLVFDWFHRDELSGIDLRPEFIRERLAELLGAEG